MSRARRQARATAEPLPAEREIIRLDGTTIETATLTEQIEKLMDAANVQGLTVTIFNDAGTSPAPRAVSVLDITAPSPTFSEARSQTTERHWSRKAPYFSYHFTYPLAAPREVMDSSLLVVENHFAGFVPVDSTGVQAKRNWEKVR